MKIVVTDATFPTLAYEQEVASEFGADFSVANCKTEEDVLSASRGADVLLVQFAPVTEKVISNLSDNALIVRYGIGLDNVDLEAAKARGIKVAYVPDYATGEVADHSATMILSSLRGLIQLDRSVRDGIWDAVGVAGEVKSFSETIVGYVGFGRIGQEVLARLAPFGFKAMVSDPYAKAEDVSAMGATLVDLNTLFTSANVITLHCPLTPETRHVVSAERLGMLPDNAVLVNTARGGLIDQDAVVEALETQRLGKAALDVFEAEPVPDDSPLRACPNLMLSPHAAWYSTSAIARLQECAADEVRRHLSGAEMRCPAFT